MNRFTISTFFQISEISIHLEILEIIGTLLQKHGRKRFPHLRFVEFTVSRLFQDHLVVHHAQLVDAFFPLLKNSRMAVRKRAISALSKQELTRVELFIKTVFVGNLVNVCSEEMFETLIQNLLKEISEAKGLNDKKTMVQFLEGIRYIWHCSRLGVCDGRFCCWFVILDAVQGVSSRADKLTFVDYSIPGNSDMVLNATYLLK